MVQRLHSVSGVRTNFYVQLRERFAHLTVLDLEQAAQHEQIELNRLNLTHPPLSYRIELLRAQPTQEPRLSPSLEEMNRIDAELEPARNRVLKTLIGN